MRFPGTSCTVKLDHQRQIRAVSVLNTIRFTVFVPLLNLIIAYFDYWMPQMCDATHAHDQVDDTWTWHGILIHIENACSVWPHKSVYLFTNLLVSRVAVYVCKPYQLCGYLWGVRVNSELGLSACDDTNMIGSGKWNSWQRYPTHNIGPRELHNTCMHEWYKTHLHTCRHNTHINANTLYNQVGIYTMQTNSHTNYM